MKSCPMCQAEMDENEHSCPQCGHRPRGKSWLRKLVGLFQPQSAAQCLEDGMNYFNRRDYTRAIVAYGKAFRRDNSLVAPHLSKLVWAHQYRADEWMRQRNAKKAIADYCEAIRLNPASVVALFGRGVAYLRLDQIEPAFADFTQAIHLQPDYYPAYLGRAECYFKQGSLDLAIADDTEAIRLEPTNAAAYRGRALMYSRKQSHDLAIADLTEAIHLEPDNPQGYALRAREYRAISWDHLAAPDEKTCQEKGGQI